MSEGRYFAYGHYAYEIFWTSCLYPEHSHVTSGGSPTPLTLKQEAAWRSYLRAHALLVRQLDQDLRVAHRMTLVTYDALVQLPEAPGQRLGMKDLAAALVYSASGLTRVVDCLERDGFARRETDPADRRASLIVLTPQGLAALRQAWPTHLHGVTRHFSDHLTPRQDGTITAVCRAITTGLRHLDS